MVTTQPGGGRLKVEAVVLGMLKCHPLLASTREAQPGMSSQVAGMPGAAMLDEIGRVTVDTAAEPAQYFLTLVAVAGTAQPDTNALAVGFDGRGTAGAQHEPHGGVTLQELPQPGGQPARSQLAMDGEV